MISSLTSFFLCKNPLAIYPEGIIAHVYHQERPRFMAALFSINPHKYVQMNYKGICYPFQYISGAGQDAVFVLHISDLIDAADEDELQELLFEGARWYASLLDKENKVQGMDGQSTLGLFKEPALLPGIKLLQVTNTGAYFVFYPDGFISFRNADAIDDFLINVLEIDEDGEVELVFNVL